MTVAVVAALVVGAVSMVVLVAKDRVSAKYMPAWVLLPMYEMELVTLAQLGEDLWLSTPKGRDFWTAGAGKRILLSVIERPQSYRDLRYALEQFVEIGEGEFAYQTALRFLGEGDPDVRHIAAYFITRGRHPTSAPSLDDLETLWQNDYEMVRLTAILGTRQYELGGRELDVFRGKLMEWLPMVPRDPSALVRATFISRLWTYCDCHPQEFYSVFPEHCLDSFLHDPDPRVVKNAIELKEIIALCKEVEGP